MLVAVQILDSGLLIFGPVSIVKESRNVTLMNRVTNCNQDEESLNFPILYWGSGILTPDILEKRIFQRKQVEEKYNKIKVN